MEVGGDLVGDFGQNLGDASCHGVGQGAFAERRDDGFGGTAAGVERQCDVRVFVFEAAVDNVVGGCVFIDGG